MKSGASQGLRRRDACVTGILMSSSVLHGIDLIVAGHAQWLNMPVSGDRPVARRLHLAQALR